MIYLILAFFVLLCYIEYLRLCELEKERDSFAEETEKWKAKYKALYKSAENLEKALKTRSNNAKKK